MAIRIKLYITGSWLQKKEAGMDYERYYIDLLEVLNSCCRNIASGKYDQNDVDRLFDLARPKRYPSLFTELAESFGTMLFKIERNEIQKNHQL